MNRAMVSRRSSALGASLPRRPDSYLKPQIEGVLPVEGQLRIRVNNRNLTFGPDDVVTIGRDPASGVVVEDQRVSRQHAIVKRQDEEWVIEDAGSANGIFCEGRRVDRLQVSEPLNIRLGGVDGPLLEVTPSLVAPVQRQRGRVGLRRTWIAQRPAEAQTSIPVGRLSAVHRPVQKEIRIGRAADNDIVLDDLLVSRHHAEIRFGPTGTGLIDLGSFNGTYVNGRPVGQANLDPGDIIGIGHHMLRVVAGSVEQYVDHGEITFQARDLVVRARDKRVVLDEVGFALEERSLLAVVGPAGSGKTTLLNSLSGLRPADEGTVMYSGRELYADYADLRQRIGIVLRDDAVHAQLTVREALLYTAELRLPPDMTREERDRRVEALLKALGLDERSAVRIAALPPSERKRVAVAMEMITRPSLLFLDEPTARFDPGQERTFMTLLRQLTDRGRTVVVATENVQSLKLCDRVLLLARGGQEAYFGPPQLAPAYFERQDFEEIFLDLSRSRDWKERFRRHEYHERYVEPSGHPGAGMPSPQAGRPAVHRAWWRQFATLWRRQLATFAADQANLPFLLFQGPVLGLLVAVLLPVRALARGMTGQQAALTPAVVLLAAVFAATWVGASTGAMAIATELAILRRERAFGIHMSAYMAAKGLVLGIVVALECAALAALAMARAGVGDAAIIGWPLGELIIGAVLIGLAAMAAALLISTLVSRTEVVVPAVAVLLMFHVIASAGGVIPEIRHKPVLRELSLASSAQWGFSALASTVDLNRVEGLAGRPSVARAEARWAHDSGAWVRSVAALFALTLAPLLAAWLALRLSRLRRT
jgi:ABC-type multidrug transport system ATPase subunit